LLSGNPDGFDFKLLKPKKRATDEPPVALSIFNSGRTSQQPEGPAKAGPSHR
jgi:hypothetical protein